MHGIFASDAFRRAFLESLSGKAASSDHEADYEARIEGTLDALAAHLEAHLDLDQLLEIARGR